MSKHFLLMIGPIGTRSGYGDHMRDIFHSLYDMDMFDIKVIDTKWGDTPRNALKQDNPKDKLILDRISKDGSLPKQPDILASMNSDAKNNARTPAYPPMPGADNHIC